MWGFYFVANTGEGQRKGASGQYKEQGDVSWAKVVGRLWGRQWRGDVSWEKVLGDLWGEQWRGDVSWAKVVGRLWGGCG